MCGQGLLIPGMFFLYACVCFSAKQVQMSVDRRLSTDYKIGDGIVLLKR